MLPLPSPAASTPPATAPAPAALDPAELLASWLSTVESDDLQPRLLRLADGRLVPLPVARWAGPVDAADESMLAAASGPVLDVGCGPGRLTAALHGRGIDVLGVEILPGVPVLARDAGAPVLLGDVFGPVPRAAQWRTALLADGNIGIGGDPVRLLRRLRGLLAPTGRIVCELHPDGDAAGPVRLEGLGAASAWFPWAVVGPAGIETAATACALQVRDRWTDSGRAFAVLAPV